MDQTNLSTILEQFSRFSVLVVGDIYLDENVYGAVTGVSLEAPIPIYEVRNRRYNPGAAGNAACNIAALGAKTYIAGYVGQDVNADIVLRSLAERGVDTSCVITHPTRPTNTYGKLRAGGFNIPDQEVLRIDTPQPSLIDGSEEEALIAQIRARAESVDAIVVVDQVSSVVTEHVIRAVVECAQEYDILTVGDSRNRIGLFEGFRALVPNDREAAKGTGITLLDETCIEYDTLLQAGRNLVSLCAHAFITRGPDGITVFSHDGSVNDVATEVMSSDVVDVTGAGDTATAAVTLALLGGADTTQAARIANAASGVAVKQRGVVTVSQKQLESVISGYVRPAKLKTVEELAEILQQMKREGKRSVWTNGCFDILHVGHITYLQRAASFGEALIVGVNGDVSVRQLKGPDRPVIPEAERAQILAALECVSYIVIFDEPDVTSMLRHLQPDIYAKGGDYNIDTINQEERGIVEGYGGAISIVPGVEGLSTTNVIKRVRG